MIDHSFSPSPNTELLQRRFQRILIIKPSSLGDVIHALPVLHGLRLRYPKAKIDWLISSTFASLIEGHEDIDELILFDRNRFHRLGIHPGATRDFVELISNLRRRRYDLVIDLQGLFRSGFFSWASGAEVRIGFRDAREAAWMFYNHRMSPSEKEIHAVDRNYQVAKWLGFDDVPVTFKLLVPQEIQDQANHLLRDQGYDHQGPLVVIAPGARWETKIWKMDRFVETIDTLQRDDPSLRCVLVGADSEAEVCRRMADRCRVKPINLAGRTNIKQLTALIGLADVVLCHDSAAMHIAVALNRPLVCLVGPTNPHRTGPYQRMEDVVQVDLSCSPCYFRQLSKCPHDHRCMTDIQTESVVSAVRQSLEKRVAVST